MKSLIFIILLCISTVAQTQVTNLNYLLDYNCETNLYEVKLKILDGNATTTTERSQFNSQISMVVPTGLDFEIVELINPIQNNQNYSGTEATNWNTFTPVISPPEQPENDFYSISPQLSPASFYNNLNEGDEVILFLCKIGESTVYNSNIRFYNNVTDPPIQSSGSDFRNGFAIGSPFQIYNINEYKSCTSNLENLDVDIKVYPNPFVDQLIIESDLPIRSLTLTDMTGVLHYSIREVNEVKLVIPTAELARGIYSIHYDTGAGSKISQIVKL